MKTVLSFAALLAVAALVAALPAGAVAYKSYADPAGDAGSGPDVTKIEVANASNGMVFFDFTYANRPSGLTGDDYLLIGIDADRNGRTGDVDGSEYVLYADVEGGALGKWTGTTYDWATPQTTLDGDPTGLAVNVSELGGIGSFDFFVLTGVGEEDADVAPEGVAMYTFVLDLRPVVTKIFVAPKPIQPIAGKAFTMGSVSIEIETGARLKPGSVSCTAKLAGKALKATGPCRWLIPAGSRGKTLAVVVKATYKGATASTKPIALKVR